LACGATLTATFSVQDGATPFGPAVADFPTGTPIRIFAEGFDGVTPPALPAGWAASNAAGGAPFWTTTTSAPDSGPNDPFILAPPEFSDQRLDSPAIPIATPSARLTFRSSSSFEPNFDGGVLEVSIGGGAFQDVLDAGGSFVSGGYTATLASSM